MASLFKIGKYILVPILSEWLVAEDFLNLDSSLTNRLARPQFLNDLSSFAKLFQSHVFNSVIAFPLSISLLKWMTSRGFSLEGMSTIMIKNSMLSDFYSATSQTSMLSSYVMPWKRPNASKNSLQVENAQKTLYPYLKTVQCLKMRQVSDSNKNALQKLFLHCSSLCELHICSPRLCTMDYVEKHCRNLKICNFSGCHVLEEISLALICRNCPQITDLHLFECWTVSSLVLQCIIVHCSNLQTLDVRGGNMITKRTVLQFSFHIRRPLLHFRYVNYTGLSLITFMHYRGCRLQGIEVSQQYISFLSLVNLPVLCPNLIHLDLHNNVYISDQDIAHLTSSLPQLERISLHKLDTLTVASLNSIVNNCHHLRELHLCYTHNINTLSLLVVHASQFTNLQRLSLRGLALMDFVLTGILTHCSSSLTDLDVSHNIEISDETFIESARHLRKLQRLIMIRLDKITHQALYAIAFNCCQLTDLSVENCKQMTDFGLLPILSECKRLTKLDASHCEQLTSDTLETIGANCRKLSHLILKEFNWDSKSSAKLPSLLDRCTKLNQLGTNFAVPAQLLKKHPNLEFTHILPGDYRHY